MTGVKRGFLTLLRDRSGNVLPIAVIGMLLSAALVGGGIDMSRAYRAQNRLQAACDSAVLAGRRKVDANGLDQPVRDQAEAFFKTNFDDKAMETNNTVFTPSTTDNGQTINAAATTELKLAVMQIFGFQKFNLSATCSSSMGVGNSDVVMVLDTTGSMTTKVSGVTRMSALQTAMKNFYATVKTATTGTNARIRYGFVPYSATVNVGKLLYAANPAYLKNSLSDVPMRKVIPDGNATTADNNSADGDTVTDATVYTSKSDCEAAMVNTSWSNNGSPSTLPVKVIVGPPSDPDDELGYRSWSVTTRQPQTRRIYTECTGKKSSWKRKYYDQTKDYDSTQKYTWQYYTANIDVTNYKTFSSVTTSTGEYGATLTSTWGGCIEERFTNAVSSFSFSTMTGITPSTALDTNIDSAPTTADTTKWGPLWPEITYVRRTSGGGYTNNATSSYGTQATSCPYDAQLLKEMDEDGFNEYVGKLKAAGSTYLDIGMVWGGRLSSPDGIFSTNVKEAPTNGGEVSRHLIFMTDGVMDPSPTSLSAWGIEYHNRRVTSDGSDSQDTSRHTSRFLAICEAIKAKGIRVWAISFTSGKNTTLSTCASANSYYNADNPTQLNSAFQEIAKQVGELRLTQ